MEQPFLSVIVPAYKEGDRIGRNLLEIDKYLKGKDYTYEIVVVVDGSPDNTAEVSRNYALQIPHLRVIDNKENHGKGYVVRQGLLETNGKWRLFLDADGSTSITHLETLVPLFGTGCDVFIGSRKIDGSFIQVHQPKHREIMGEGGNWLIRIVLGLWRYPDTQCGFKVLSDKAAKAIATRMVVDRFGFDFELIVLAIKLGFTVKQLPVRWMNEEGSTVKLTGPNGFIQVLIDLFKTKWRLLTGAYHVREYYQEIKAQKETS
ncbi:MAG: glycosyltransferase family 2 protein [Candidatus Moranbacteria bacterium]|nr:glycosyltransferase family 2 protein [Candidatus Moranbacteria bacterium]